MEMMFLGVFSFIRRPKAPKVSRERVLASVVGAERSCNRDECVKLIKVSLVQVSSWI